jgi:hypothetical protein
MKLPKPFVPVGTILACMMLVIPLGCSSGGSTSGVDPKGEAVHITEAAGHVGRYMADNKGKAPKDTSEMKDWAAKNNIAEDKLHSTRDHEPYEVREVTMGQMKQLVLTERTGVKGRKFMWRSNSPGGLGMEKQQDEIDAALKNQPGRAD